MRFLYIRISKRRLFINLERLCNLNPRTNSALNPPRYQENLDDHRSAAGLIVIQQY